MDQQVNLATNAELWQIDAWLDGAARRWEQKALILRLKIVEVGAIAVNGCVNVVPSAMHVVIAVAGSGDDRARDIIDLAALNAPALLQLLAHEMDGGVTRPAHDIEDFKLAFRNLLASAGKSHPRVIGIDGARLRQVCPEVEKYQVATLDGAMLLSGRPVMRIADVGIDGYMRIGPGQSQAGNQ